MSLKCYLAGPMRGYAEFNFPAFHAAAAELRAAGFEVFSPAEHDEGNGIDVTGTKGDETLKEQGFSLRAALRDDLDFICTVAEAVIVLPKWLNSLGARAEVSTAKALGIPVVDVHTAVIHGPEFVAKKGI